MFVDNGQIENGIIKIIMSKYDPLWHWIKENGTDRFVLSYTEIERITGLPIDHSFLTYKKELLAYGYKVGKIAMKLQTVSFEKNTGKHNLKMSQKEKSCK